MHFGCPVRWRLVWLEIGIKAVRTGNNITSTKIEHGKEAESGMAIEEKALTGKEPRPRWQGSMCE
jgi:hypothetical protein